LPLRPLDVEGQHLTRPGHHLAPGRELAGDALDEIRRVVVPLDVVDLNDLVAHMHVPARVRVVPLLHKASLPDFLDLSWLPIGIELEH
jgi:hypothetical protein